MDIHNYMLKKWEIQTCIANGRNIIKNYLVSKVTIDVIAMEVMVQKVISYQGMLICHWKFTKMNYKGRVKLGNQKMVRWSIISYNLKQKKLCIVL
jgi:hypothetical protein